MRWIRPDVCLVGLTVLGSPSRPSLRRPAPMKAGPSGRREGARGPRRRHPAAGGGRRPGVDPPGLFKGDPAGGDLFYVTTAGRRIASLGRSGSTASRARRSRSGRSAAARSPSAKGAGSTSPGTARKARRRRTRRRNADALHAVRPDRSLRDPRNPMHRTSGLDGGGTIAADSAGNVYVAWHGRTDDAPRRGWSTDVGRCVRDEGATFTAEEPALIRATGACGCCGTRGLADRGGRSISSTAPRPGASIAICT